MLLFRKQFHLVCFVGKNVTNFFIKQCRYNLVYNFPQLYYMLQHIATMMLQRAYHMNEKV